ncbi:MAG: hypothetical protein ACYTJ0_04620, partial [Planctomycetota bacterium]
MKRLVPLWIAIVCGFVLIVAYFFSATVTWGEEVSVWFDILAAIAFILGGGNLLKIHLKKMSDRVAGWGYSAVTVVSFLLMLFIGLFKVGVNPSEQFPTYSWSGTYNEMGTPFWWLYEYAFKPLQATTFAMLAFYVASAAFRAFRAKNFEAILLLGTAFIILLGRTFAGVWLTSWMPESLSGLRIENLTVYIMSVFNTAGNRAIMIGIALGI